MLSLNHFLTFVKKYKMVTLLLQIKNFSLEYKTVFRQFTYFIWTVFSKFLEKMFRYSLDICVIVKILYSTVFKNKNI